MQFEWDENKNSKNIRKHGLDFADTWQVFQNPLLVKVDDRVDYGEDRWTGVGMMANGIVIVLVFSEREPETIRIISLRKATKSERNKYEKAIKSCGNILKIYDSFQMFPVYGFGGVPFKGKEVSHCFNINMKKDPKISGLDEVLQYYVESLKLVDLVGPTYFQQIIKNTMETIKKEIKENTSVYHVFLILTDGKIDDMNETKHILVEASKMPLSIIIVGIGSADFGKMTELSKFINIIYNFYCF